METMSSVNTIGLFVFLAWTIFTGPAEASHFRGGIITWQPLSQPNATHPNVLPRLKFSYRMAWRRSSGHYCDETDIEEENVLSGEGYLSCSCSGLYQPLNYICTDFSTADDWTTGVNTFEYQPSETSFEVWFTDCCWINLNNGGSGWDIGAFINLTVRNDTGRINTSPTTTTLPIVTFQRECNNTIKIPVFDADGDDVRCFWATHRCGGICTPLTNAVLNNATCEITWEVNVYNALGLYGVAIEIEDYASSESTVPLSRIPLQFLVDLISSSSPCSLQPVFIGPTRDDGSCIGISPNATFHESIVVRTGSSEISLMEIDTVSPPGVIKSEILPYPGGNLTDYYINITWTPQTFGVEKLLCFSARDSNGVPSTQSCISLVTGTSPPEIKKMYPSRGSLVLQYDVAFQLAFNQNVVRPQRSTFISVFDQYDNLVYQIDANIPGYVYYTIANTLAFNISTWILPVNAAYYITMEDGAAKTTTFCGIESAAITDKTFWTFTVSHTCGNQFDCMNGVCIPMEAVCDGYTDCGNGADERKCSEPTDDIILQCGPSSFQVDIPLMLLAGLLDPTQMYLAGDSYSPECKGFINGDYVRLNSSLDGCGTEYSDNQNVSYYTNAIVNADNSSSIVIYVELYIPISCEYKRSKTLQTNYVIISDYVMKQMMGSFVYGFAMYTDIYYTTMYNAYPVMVNLGTKLYLRAELLQSAGNLELHARRCYATPSSNYDDQLSYEFIRDGCGVNNAAVRLLIPQRKTQVDFEIVSFRFKRDLMNATAQIWIHCEVLVCDVDDVDSECRRGCEQPRYRRSAGSSYMTTSRIVQGPIMILNDGEEKSKTLITSNDSPDGSANIFTIALSGVTMFMFLGLVVMVVILRNAMRKLKTSE